MQDMQDYFRGNQIEEKNKAILLKIRNLKKDTSIFKVVKSLKEIFNKGEFNTEEEVLKTKSQKNELRAPLLEKITMEDIPTYMTGDAGGFSLFQKQMDKGAERVLYYNAKDNRQLFNNRNDDSDAEVMVKKEESFDKPIPEEDKEQLFDVLCLYLKAEGPRGKSATTIGIKIPKDIDPSLFMKKLAKEVYEAGKNMGALYISSVNEMGWGGFNVLQDKLKSFAKEKFLEYANKQLNREDSNNQE